MKKLILILTALVLMGCHHIADDMGHGDGSTDTNILEAPDPQYKYQEAPEAQYQYQEAPDAVFKG